jgi:hypothetical protein
MIYGVAHPKNMTAASCAGEKFYAPAPLGQLLCKTLNITYDHHPVDKDFINGTKCRILCGDALAIPEFVFCTENGWDISSDKM